MKKLLATLCLFPAGVFVAIVFAFAQSAPNWPTGYNPTTAEINAAFAQKLDATNGTFNGVVNATTLNVSGLSTLAGSLTVAGNETVGGTLTVGGLITFTNLAVTGTTTLASTLSVSGPATLASAVVTGNETVGGTLGVTGATTVASLAVTNNSTVGGNETVTGSLRASGALSGAQRDFLSGLTLSRNSTTVLGVSAGEAADSGNTVDIQLGAFTKSTGGTWAAGTGANGMGTGLTIANATWYHVFAIINAGSPDIYFDTSVTAANKPASTTAFRRIGSFLTDGSAQILAFSQNGDEFLWSASVRDVAGVTPLTTAVLATLSVPLGVKVNALYRAGYGDSGASASGIVFTSPDETDQAPNVTTTGLSLSGPQASATFGAFGQFNTRTNTSSQLRYRATGTTTNVLNISTYGWIDSRGKNN